MFSFSTKDSNWDLVPKGIFKEIPKITDITIDLKDDDIFLLKAL